MRDIKLSDLECKILTILDTKKNDEHIYLRGHSELQDFSQEEILKVSEKLTDKGYLNLYWIDEMIEVDNSLVNYFYEITETGRKILCPMPDVG